MGKRGTLNHSGGLILPARRPQRHLAERQLPLRRVHRPQAGPAAAAVAAVAATQLVLRRSQGQRCEQAFSIDAIPTDTKNSVHILQSDFRSCFTHDRKLLLELGQAESSRRPQRG